MMKEEALSTILKKAAEDRYGKDIPAEISVRLQTEWEVIQTNGWEADFFRAYWIAQALRQEDIPWIFPGVDGGCSLIAFLLGITCVDPLPPHYYCSQCKKVKFVPDAKDGFDLPETVCSNCGGVQHGDGHQCEFSWFSNREYAPFIECHIPNRGVSVIARAISALTPLTPTTSQMFRKKYCFEGWLLTPPEQLKNASWVEIDDPLHPGKKMNAVIDDYELWEAHPHVRIFPMDGLDFLDQFCQKTGIKADSIPANDRHALRSLFSAMGKEQLTETNLACSTGLYSQQDDGDHAYRELRQWAAQKVPSFSNLVQFQGMYHMMIVGAEELPYDLCQMFCDRDSLLELLSRNGILKETIFPLAEKIRKGNGHKSEVKAQLKKLKIDPQIVAAIEHIGYLFPRAYAVSYGVLYARLAWFSLHYPEEYRQATTAMFKPVQ